MSRFVCKAENYAYMWLVLTCEPLSVFQETLQSELGMNKGLAMTYRKLQGQHVDLKSRVMDMFDERNRLEAGIKDLKQLKGKFLHPRLSRRL